MRHDSVLLLDMLLAAQSVQEYTADVTADSFYANRLIQSAVLRELQVIGEAARMITSATKDQHPEIAWQQIAGMRNRIIHEYFTVRLPIVWDVVENDIPALIAQLEVILPPEND